MKAHATAELTVAAKYEVRKKVTQHIPEDVTRAKTSAWLTLISPITQWAGLKGDQLAHKRELLRIHQEETLTEIVRRAVPRMSKLERPIAPVPVKFLVPFLEKASLEERDSKLVDLWSSLLASAAENYDPHYVYFASVISQLSAQQAQIFEAAIGPQEPDTTFCLLERMFLGFVRDFVQDAIKYSFDNCKKIPGTREAMAKFIEEILHVDGVVVIHIDLNDTKNNDHDTGYAGYCPSYSKYEDEDETDYTILCGLQLLSHVDTGQFMLGKRWNVKILYYHVTSLGFAFAKACGVRSKHT